MTIPGEARRPFRICAALPERVTVRTEAGEHQGDRMPAGTAVAKVEKNLARGARKRGFTGRRKARYIYGALNNAGLMHGNKATAKGLQRSMSERAKARRSTGH